MIKVYSTPTCPLCKKVKSYLESKNLSFENINVFVDKEQRAEMFEISGQTGVPVINVDGKVIIGFDKKEIDESIEKYIH